MNNLHDARRGRKARIAETIRVVVKDLASPDRRPLKPTGPAALFPDRGSGVPENVLIAEVRGRLGLEDDAEITATIDGMIGRGELRVKVARLRQFEKAARGRVEATVYLPGVSGNGSKPDCTHSGDFTTVVWYGRRYQFAKGGQAEVVRVLWEEWERCEGGLSAERIFEQIGSHADRPRLDHVFRGRTGKGYHPAWGTMLRSVRKGVYRLTPPE